MGPASGKQSVLGEFDGEEMHECPTCGRVFDTNNGMKVHHGLKHGESIAGVEMDCEWCGDTFRRAQCFIDQADHHFCGMDCQREWQYHKGTTQVECDNCGTEFRKINSSVEAYDHHFCDRDCYDEYHEATVVVTCEWCGDDFEKYHCQAKVREKHFCGRECFGDWFSHSQRGEKNHRWLGGYDGNYGWSWKIQRRKAIERDGEQCVMCGLDRDGHHRLYGHDLEVHHKTPFIVYGVESHLEANRLENLITVCKSCHYSLDEISRKRAIEQVDSVLAV